MYNVFSEFPFTNILPQSVQVLAPSLCSLLCRVRQRLSREKDLGEAYVNLLKEHSVSLLSHLVTLAHFLCWQKTDNKVHLPQFGIFVHWYMYVQKLNTKMLIKC